MKINFHGAAQTVTGSKHLITLDNGEQLLLDCGMFQGMGDETTELNDVFGFKPSGVTYMVLSHAHIDHSGLIPKLVAEGFKGPIYCTSATMELTRILLMDSAKIQQQDADYLNSMAEGTPGAEHKPMYTEDDVNNAMHLFKVVDFDTDVELSSRITIRLTDTGHILGSAAVHVTVFEDAKLTQVTFSGDVGRYGDMLLRSPQGFPQADHIILESTYGNSLHSELEPIEDELYDVIHQTCILRGGKIIIPAFSVGRTQEILYALNTLELKGRLPDIPVYVDSPLAEKATQVIKGHTELFNKNVQEVLKTDSDVFAFKGLRFIESIDESRKLNSDPRPCVIIASSGMAEAGRVRNHIRDNIENAKNTILMVGYAEPRSLAGQLALKSAVVKIFGKEYSVLADVRLIKSMSAHGDYNDLLHFVKCQDVEQVKTVFLVHGEFAVQQLFSERLNQAGFKNVQIPKLHEEVVLNMAEVNL
jgi:metallo-beta-lactamase family protein